MPCLWIGISSKRNHASPWYPGYEMPDEIWSPGVEEAAEEVVQPPAGRPGQFIIQHQYEGHACSQVMLSGAILPLSSCNDMSARSGLTQLTEKFFEQPFQWWWPNLDELILVRDEMRSLGPIEPTERFRDLGEAYLTFDLSTESYRWIELRFQMVTEVEDINGLRILSLGPLPPNYDAFIEWMGGVAGPCYGSWVHGALLYENSD